MRKEMVTTKYKCLTPSLTPSKIRQFQEILVQNDVGKVRELLEVISGEARLRILFLLSKHQSLSVADIADILRSKVSGISHQLRILKDYDLVVSKKKERVVYYSLSDNIPALVKLSLSESSGE